MPRINIFVLLLCNFPNRSRAFPIPYRSASSASTLHILSKYNAKAITSMASLPHQRAIHSRMQPQRARGRSKSPIKCVCANFLDFSVCVSACLRDVGECDGKRQINGKTISSTTYLYRRGRNLRGKKLCRKQKGPL